MLTAKEITKPKALSQVLPQTRNFKWPFKYDKSGSRDLRLDFLRGFCLFVMLIDHVGVFGPDSWLYVISGRGEFFISAAEGFVLISGLILGIVYSKVIAKEGLRAATKKVLSRTVKIYWLTVGLTLFFVSLATFTPLQIWAERDWIQIKDPIELIVGSLTLHFAFHGSSILVMYVLLLGMSPLIFYLLHEGKTFTVLAVSWIIWAADNFYPNEFNIPFASNFPFAAWQTIFVTALVIGYHRQAIQKRFSARAWNYYFLVIGSSSLLLLSFYIASLHDGLTHLFPGVDFTGLLNDMNNKGTLPFARMLAVFILFQGLYILATWVWKVLEPLAGWLLIPIGEVSLYSFSMHLVIIVLFYNIPGVRELPYFWYGFALFGTVLGMWAMVKTHFLFNIIPH
jgi:hypothetical protein